MTTLEERLRALCKRFDVEDGDPYEADEEPEMTFARAAAAIGAELAYEDAASVADECWHGPGDHGCDHGKAIADAIRARAGTTEGGKP